MHSTLTTLLDRLDSSAISGTDVIPWGAPVPSFGDLSRSRVATLGLNPSNREFMDESGNELQGAARRFHTLRSLRLASWASADARHLHMILETCRTYFQTNPYDRWFKRLDAIISATNASYYNRMFGACHLDLIPYATACKWTELTTEQRLSLMDVANDTLGLLLRESPVQVLILNGRSVVDHFEKIAGISLEAQEMADWSLPRQTTPDVAGFAFIGEVGSLAGISLGREVQILGYNHNIQSSFGVTREVINAIRDWIGRTSREVLQ